MERGGKGWKEWKGVEMGGIEWNGVETGGKGEERGGSEEISDGRVEPCGGGWAQVVTPQKPENGVEPGGMGEKTGGNGQYSTWKTEKSDQREFPPGYSTLLSVSIKKIHVSCLTLYCCDGRSF